MKDIAKKKKVPLETVVMNDEARSINLHDNVGVIINLQNSDKSGSHWVLCVRVDGVNYYFDSYACPPSDDVLKMLKRDKDDCIQYNDTQIQGFDESFCGIACLYVLHELVN